MPWPQPYPDAPGETMYSRFVLTVLYLDHDVVIDIAAFEQPSMFRAFGLPASR